jgi:hypothetical protein
MCRVTLEEQEVPQIIIPEGGYFEDSFALRELPPP